jgi:cytochrome c biogenesis protein CcmG/thiol:disulfide interchange protein DsbE
MATSTFSSSSGSLREGSKSPAGDQITPLLKLNVPHPARHLVFNQDLEASQQPTGRFSRCRNRMACSSSPEYNRDPGVLKNAIDVGSRPLRQVVSRQAMASSAFAGPARRRQRGDEPQAILPGYSGTIMGQRRSINNVSDTFDDRATRNRRAVLSNISTPSRPLSPDTASKGGAIPEKLIGLGLERTSPMEKRCQPWLLALPLLAFLALATIFGFRLGDGDPSRIPSALIPSGAAKHFAIAASPRQEWRTGASPAVFKGKVSVVNVWASWCVPCHEEATLLTELSQDKRLQLVGINYKDAPDNALRFLGRHGNPFDIVGVDGNGRAAIEWGVYGVPETFIVGRDGKIVYKLVGPLTPDNIGGVLKSKIDEAVK